MITLRFDPAPVTVDITIAGARASFTCHPVSNGDMEAYNARAIRIVDDIDAGLAAAEQFGFMARDPDLDDPDIRTGMIRQIVIEELAVDKIIAWSGIAQADADMAGIDAGIDPAPELQPAQLNPDAVRLCMRLYPVGQLFFSRLMEKQHQRVLAKNASRLSAGGSTPPAAGLNTAKDAPSSTAPAPGASAE